MNFTNCGIGSGALLLRLLLVMQFLLISEPFKPSYVPSIKRYGRMLAVLQRFHWEEKRFNGLEEFGEKVVSCLLSQSMECRIILN